MGVLELAGRDAAEAADLARDCASRGVDALVVVGGDGIVHLGLQVVAGTQLPLGIIPAGTGNDIARAIGLPRGDPAEAAQVVARGVVRRIDLGRSDGAWFGGVAAAGFDARVNDRANRMTWPRGRTRYNLALLLELGLFRPVRYEMCLDGVTLDMEAMLVAVANGPCYGAGMQVAPQASVDDGLLDVLIVHRISKAELIRVFPRVYRGTHVGHPAVEIRRARTVRLAASGITAYADGERLGALPREFLAVPGALRVLAAGPVPDR